jgi:hypothetical protein
MGVQFALRPGVPMQLAWTQAGSADAFLAVDWNNNGVIDDGSELFGNFSPQPPTSDRNGFRSLAQFDSVEMGGNNNGRIDIGDAFYDRVLLWFDRNHDGVSQPGELVKLADLKVEWISLDYKESAYVDQYGNRFRYRANVHRTAHQSLTSFAWDVFLTSDEPPME